MQNGYTTCVTKQNEPTKGAFIMNAGKQTIKCTVKQCTYNDTTQEHCTLNAITVGTHECNPTEEQCTDCMSFKLGK